MNLGLTGLEAELALGKAHITVNKNTIPNESRSPFVTSGLRIGDTGGDHTRHEGGGDATDRHSIATVLKDIHNEATIKKVGAEVHEMAKGFPLYPE